MNTKNLGYIPSDETDLNYSELKPEWEGNITNEKTAAVQGRVQSTEHRLQSTQYIDYRAQSL